MSERAARSLKLRGRRQQRSSSKWSAFLENDAVRFWIQVLAIPAAAGLVTLIYQHYETQRTLIDKRVSLYTELVSKREQGDIEVRRSIFEKVIEKYLQPEANLENKMVALDLMSANFHDSLDLSPLFWQLDRLVSNEPDVRLRERHLDELARIAGDVKARQVEVLRLAGQASEELEVGLDPPLPGKMVPSQGVDLKFTAPVDVDGKPGKEFTKHFEIDIIEPDKINRRLRVSVRYVNERKEERSILLWADLYDFPLVTFTRLSTTERLAAVLTEYKAHLRSAKVVVIYYPSARSGVKDKPFIDEVLQNLVKQP